MGKEMTLFDAIHKLYMNDEYKPCMGIFKSGVSGSFYAVLPINPYSPIVKFRQIAFSPNLVWGSVWSLPMERQEALDMIETI